MIHLKKIEDQCKIVGAGKEDCYGSAIRYE